MDLIHNLHPPTNFVMPFGLPNPDLPLGPCLLLCNVETMNALSQSTHGPQGNSQWDSLIWRKFILALPCQGCHRSFLLLGWGASQIAGVLHSPLIFQPDFKDFWKFRQLPTSKVVPFQLKNWGDTLEKPQQLWWNELFFSQQKKIGSPEFLGRSRSGSSRKHLVILNWLVTLERLREIQQRSHVKRRGWSDCFFRPLPIIQKMHGVCLVDPFLVNNVGVQYFLKVFPRSIPFLPCFHNAAGIF